MTIEHKSYISLGILFMKHLSKEREQFPCWCFVPALSDWFQLPFNRWIIFTPGNEEDNFPSATVFQEHLALLKGTKMCACIRVGVGVCVCGVISNVI